MAGLSISLTLELHHVMPLYTLPDMVLWGMFSKGTLCFATLALCMINISSFVEYVWAYLLLTYLLCLIILG